MTVNGLVIEIEFLCMVSREILCYDRFKRSTLLKYKSLKNHLKNNYTAFSYCFIKFLNLSGIFSVKKKYILLKNQFKKITFYRKINLSAVSTKNTFLLRRPENFIKIKVS